MNPNINEIVILLSRGITQRQIYFNNHPKVLACCREFTHKLKLQLKNEDKTSFFLGVAGRQLIYSRHYLLGASIVGRKIVDSMEKLASGGLLFSDRVEEHEVVELFGLMAELPNTLSNLEEARTLLKSKGIQNIELSPVYEDPEWFGQDGDADIPWEDEAGLDDSVIKSLVPIYQSMFSTVEHAHQCADSNRDMDANESRTISGKLLRSMKGTFTDIMQLVQYPDFDSYTVGHSVRVAMLAVLVGRSMNMPQHLLLELGTAGLLHDIGKTKIPDEILFKRGRLTAEERRIVEQHPALGAQIILEGQNASPLIVAIAWGHHLRHDHCGYPASPCWAIHNDVTAFIHVCDVYEALTAVRPYKNALSPRRAYEIMLKDHGSFHPGALRAFIAAMGLYPPGSRVMLSNGEQAVVIATGKDIEKPSVRITHNSDGSVATDMRELDLGAEELPPVSVLRLLTNDSVAEPEEPRPESDTSNHISDPPAQRDEINVADL